MPFADSSFDCVYSVATMEHIHRIDLAFAEMIRVTKMGGWIYCFAAPLWNSRKGHHLFNFLGDYPWIHLRKSQAQIHQFCEENNLTGSVDDISQDIDFIYSGYLNFLPARRYLEVCAELIRYVEIINNNIYL